MIWAIRACKTAAEERAVVRRECAAIRAAISEMSSVYRPPRETDFARFPSSTPIVIDNGASTFRIG